MIMHMNREMHEMTRSVICGQVELPSAQGGRLFRCGSAFVALKIENVVASIESTMRLQLKLTPRRMNFAIRTLVLDFCFDISDEGWIRWGDAGAYQVPFLFHFSLFLFLF
jgi:hypothetical protein